MTFLYLSHSSLMVRFSAEKETTLWTCSAFWFLVLTDIIPNNSHMYTQFDHRCLIISYYSLLLSLFFICLFVFCTLFSGLFRILLLNHFTRKQRVRDCIKKTHVHSHHLCHYNHLSKKEVKHLLKSHFHTMRKRMRQATPPTANPVPYTMPKIVHPSRDWDCLSAGSTQRVQFRFISLLTISCWCLLLFALVYTHLCYVQVIFKNNTVKISENLLELRWSLYKQQQQTKTGYFKLNCSVSVLWPNKVTMYSNSKALWSH